MVINQAVRIRKNKATCYRLQDPYLSNMNLSTPDQLNIYNKAIYRINENDRYDLTRSKGTHFYQ